MTHIVSKTKGREVRKMVKKVRFDFLREGNIGCCHVEVDCQNVEDLKEALEFAKEASQLMPQVGMTYEQRCQVIENTINSMPLK